jgi:signal peptidase I
VKLAITPVFRAFLKVSARRLKQSFSRQSGAWVSDLSANDPQVAPLGSSQDQDVRPRDPNRKPKRRPKTPLQSFLWFVRDVVIILLVAIVVSFVVKTFLVRSFFIPSQSMLNTLHVDDRVIVNELVPDIMPVQHGDVVVFKDPGGWLHASPHQSKGPIGDAIDWTLSLVGLTSPDNDQHLIKRVIGLPGDTVRCCTPEGKLTINGVPITEPYIVTPPGVNRASEVNFSVTVPKDSYWVMGDNRYNSADSRYNVDKPGKGFVAKSDVVGRAFVLSWPVKNWTWLTNYPDVFQDVPKVAVDPAANTTPTVAPRD